MDQKPLNYSPLPPAMHSAPAEPPHAKAPTMLIIMVVFVISAIAAAALVAVQSTRNSAIVVPTPTPTVVTTPTATPADGVSSDDSLDIIDREVTSTPESDTTKDSKSIENDINGL